MKFYVAGKWEEREGIRQVQQALIALGHEITKDWTVDEEDTPGFPIINVVEDIQGIQQADVYVGIFLNNHFYKGALVELGAALATRRQVCIIGNAINSCLFVNHPLVRKFETNLEFLHFVENCL